jgi:stress response protein YsnF
MDSPEIAKPAPQTADASDEVRVSAVQERLEVGVDTVETGSVRVRKVVHEELQPVSVPLHSQHVEVRRVAINRPVEERFEPRREGDTLIVPVFEYVPVVKLQLTLKEEVHITTTESQQEVVRQIVLASEELVVERREGADGQWKPEKDPD